MEIRAQNQGLEVSLEKIVSRHFNQWPPLVSWYISPLSCNEISNREEFSHLAPYTFLGAVHEPLCIYFLVSLWFFQSIISQVLDDLHSLDWQQLVSDSSGCSTVCIPSECPLRAWASVALYVHPRLYRGLLLPNQVSPIDTININPL